MKSTVKCIPSRECWSLCCLSAVYAWSAGPAIGGPCTPPPNEDCDGAIVFGTVDLPFNVTAPLGCVNDIIDKPYFDIFYRYDCTQTGVHNIDMCDSDGDTYIRIYGDGCGFTTGFELAVADDECPGSPPNADPQLSIVLEAGQSYWFELGTWRPTPPWAPPLNSPYQFNVSLAGAEPFETCDGTNLEMVLLGAPGNAADTNGLGDVAELRRIGLFEVSNREWVDFLNAVATSDPNALFDQNMTDSGRGGIIRAGSPGSFSYFVKAPFGDKPANFITWLDAARYCNWLHNGQPDAPQGASTTEDGAYDMSLPIDQIVRKPGATWFIPTHDEWYKTAYHDPINPGADGSGTPDFWRYPTQSDSQPAQATVDSVGDVTNPGASVANFGGGADWNGENGNVSSVGTATSTSHWGAMDMAGNLLEWTETLDNPIPPNPPGQPDPLPTRTARGGDFSNAGILMSSPDGFSIALNMVAEAGNVGFRVASLMCPGDFDVNNRVDADDAAEFELCFSGPDGGPVDPLCAVGDFDGDTDVDCRDWDEFLLAWTEETDLPTLAQCSATAAVPAVSTWGMVAMTLAMVAIGAIVLARRDERQFA